jgi:hypothetical protein
MTTENQASPKIVGEPRPRWPALTQEWPGQIRDVERDQFIEHVRKIEDPATEHRAQAVANIIILSDSAGDSLSKLRSWLHSISDSSRDGWLDEAIKRLDELAAHYERERM